jgi:hypothetical protein
MRQAPANCVDHSVVYMAFAAVPDGATQLELMGGQWPPFVSLDTVSPWMIQHALVCLLTQGTKPSPGLFVFATPVETLFNDATADDANELAKIGQPHAMNALLTPVQKPLWSEASLKDRRVAIRTTNDAVFPVEAQDMFLNGSGVDWETEDINAG